MLQWGLNTWQLVLGSDSTFLVGHLGEPNEQTALQLL